MNSRCALHVHAATLALSIGAGLVLGGCVSTKTTQDQPWSTKQESILAGGPPRLAVESPSRDEHGMPEAAGAALGELPTWRASAIQLLQEAGVSPNPQLRANAIEALHPSPADAASLIRQGLGDENRAVRYVAAMSVGTLRLNAEVSLVEPLLLDESESVRAAAMFALKRCDRPVDLSPLSRMLRSSSPETRANAAFILGELGDPTAARMIEEAMAMGLPRADVITAKLVDLQMAEAMVKLGRDSMLEGIRAALYSPEEQGEFAALAAQMCGELKDRRAAAYLFELATREGDRASSAEIRMAAVAALARMGARDMPQGVVEAYVGNERPELRAQAAMTLGVVGDRRAMGHLVRLLQDSNPSVQVAAAGGILRLEDA